jgi:NAD(P)-dependent dehydrogenase (short-subunit alcohol dehydrogenase family)
VNALCPGTIDTAIARAVVEGNEKRFEALSKSAPIGRIGKPEEIASAVLWLCSPGSELRGRPCSGGRRWADRWFRGQTRMSRA